MEFKRRRMIRSELDRLLSDEGTRNLLNGIKVLNKNKKLGRIVTRNKGNRKNLHINNSSANSTITNTNKTKKIIKKSMSLLGHHVVKKISNGDGNGSSSTSSSSNSSSNNSGGYTNGLPQRNNANNNNNNTTGNNSKPKVSLLATSRRDHVGFITLAYQSHLCTLNNQDLRELTRKFEEYESRDGISVIVLNSSSDRIFCDGFEYSELIHSDLNKRKQLIQQRIHLMKNFLVTLAKSKKILVASVNGLEVSGFGLMFLGMFDLVYANDKATFTLKKYLKLKQPPEGISIFNESQLNSPRMKSCVYSGKTYTSSEMYEGNLLVTEILWDGSRYHEQLALILIKIQNVNFHKNTKFIYKTYSSKNMKQLNTELTQELSILESIWMSDTWQVNCQQLQNNQLI